MGCNFEGCEGEATETVKASVSFGHPGAGVTDVELKLCRPHLRHLTAGTIEHVSMAASLATGELELSPIFPAAPEEPQ